MTEPSEHQVAQLLKAWSEGEATALEKIMPLVYRELHGMARCYMAHERPGHTLQPTALVHKVSPKTVNRDWKFAKSWQRRELSREWQSGT
jgi:hypothetical protein